MNLHTEADHRHRFPYLCPQCGCPTHGSATLTGRSSSYCEDCTSDREIDDTGREYAG